MHAAAPLAQQPPRAAATARPVRGQRVCVPWRLVAGDAPDVAVSVYTKTSALAARRALGCEASVPELARILGMSVRAVERGLTALINPDAEGVTELPTRRRTHPGGRAYTASRTPRPLADGEPYVWLTVGAADSLRPRLFRAYAAIAYAAARGLPVSYTELAQLLRHRTGTTTGQALTERSIGRLVDELAAAGWITVDRRGGHQGRHAYTVHRHPLHPVTTPTAPDTDGGSGPDTDGGSLTIKEDLETTHETTAQAGGPIRRRRDTGGIGAEPVDTPGNGVPAAFRPAPAPAAAYGGPALQLSPRVWHVLDPVRHLLPGIRPYLLRRIAHEVGHQLDTGTHPARLRDRLTHRYASTEPVGDPGRWILGAGLPRHGCGLTACESGVIWHTGMRCEVCAELRADRRREHRHHPPEPPPEQPASPPPLPIPA